MKSAPAAAIIALLVLACTSAALATCVSYEGYQVLRISVVPSQLEMLRELESNPALSLDWWTDLPMRMTSGEVTADVMVSPFDLPYVTQWLSSHNVPFSIFIEDVEAADRLQRVAAPLTGNAAADWFTAYHDVNTTNDWVKSLVNQYSSLASLQTLGQTYEGRPIYVVKVSGKSSGATKPVIFYDGGIHAREWISPTTVQYILFNLLSKYGNDTELTQLVDNIDWYIVPILNVDGYHWTRTKDRMWRKTRAPNQGSSCAGTDLNRNAATGWGGEGSSSAPCSETYHGKKAWDQVELASLSKFLAAIPNLKAYINFHSYSQLFMSPYGYKYDLPPAADYQKQTELGNAFVAAIKATTGKIYTAETAATLYIASGTIADWVYAELKVVYSFICELRDTGTYGFLLPPAQIIPTGEEILAGVRVMGKYILSH